MMVLRVEKTEEFGKLLRRGHLRTLLNNTVTRLHNVFYPLKSPRAKEMSRWMKYLLSEDPQNAHKAGCSGMGQLS